MNLPNLNILNQPAPNFQPSETVNHAKVLPTELANHTAFSQVFQADKLTLGLIAPFKGYPDTAIADIHDLGELAQQAEQAGFSALWIRDVPFYDPNFGDVGQGLDPMMTLGYLSAKTSKIALGTAGLVSPLREPIHIAKASLSADVLSGGRFILGLSSGDRPVEYPAFKADFDNRAERFRESFDLIRTLAEENFPTFNGKYYGNLSGNIDLVPKIKHRLPMVAIGRARQELSWLANTADAWIWHGVNPDQTANIVNTLADLNQDGFWRPFGYANFVELSDNPNEPARLFNNIYLRGGAKGLLEFWQQQKEQGLAHVTINLKPSRRPAEEMIAELGEEVVAKLNG